MKHIFILNPVSGKADATVVIEPLLRLTAEKLGLNYTCVHTQAVGHAAMLAQSFAQEGTPMRLYACSGDGTLNEVMRGAYPYPHVEVGSIPCGSGNDFVRTFGTPQEFLQLEDNLLGTAVPVDLIAANEGISAAICSVGVDSEVAYNIPKYRRMPLCGGQMAYNLSIIERLCRPLGEHLLVKIDGEMQEDEFLLAAVCNGVSYGGGYFAAPTADVQDGLLEVVLVKKISRLRIARVLSLYKSGKHISNGAVIPELQDIMTYVRASNIEIKPLNKQSMIVNIDGECGPAPGLSAGILPSAARFVLPQQVYLRYKKERQKAIAM